MSEGAWVKSDGMVWNEEHQAWEQAWGGGFSLDLSMTTAADLARFTKTSGVNASVTANGVTAAGGTTSNSDYSFLSEKS